MSAPNEGPAFAEDAMIGAGLAGTAVLTGGAGAGTCPAAVPGVTGGRGGGGPGGGPGGPDMVVQRGGRSDLSLSLGDAHGALGSRVCACPASAAGPCVALPSPISPQRTSLPTMSSRDHLRTLPAIRERCSRVFSLGQQGKLEYFTYHADKEPGVIDYCTSIIKVR